MENAAFEKLGSVGEFVGDLIVTSGGVGAVGGGVTRRPIERPVGRQGGLSSNSQARECMAAGRAVKVLLATGPRAGHD